MGEELSDRRSNAPSAPQPEAEHADVRLRRVVADLAEELRPGRSGAIRVRLGSLLDRDLGFDSLARAELLARIERAFEVRLAASVLAQADTVGDLLKAVLAAGPGVTAPPVSEIRLPAGEGVDAAPSEARTLLGALDWHARRSPNRIHVVLCEESGEERPLTYGALASEAKMLAAGLQQRGLAAGDHVAVMLPTGIDFLRSFFGVLYAGGAPVPIYPPVRASRIEEHLRRQAAILDNAQATMLITAPELRTTAAMLKHFVPSLRCIETPRRLAIAGAAPTPVDVSPGSYALLQYTSGSTGSPKGVILTHANLLANIRAMAEALEADSSDVFVSWLPLYHDMGLIGAWLGSLYCAMPFVLMSPLSFLTRPESWLRAIDRHRATLTASPNFAFELCVSKIDESKLEGLDLSSLRVAMNGAEPIIPETLRRFAARFSEYGFRPEAMTPVYGLAENSVGLAFPTLGRGPLVDRVKRAALVELGRAESAPPDGASALECVACGRPLRGHDLRIVDSNGRELGERREGRLEFRGPSATSGYFRNEEATRELRRGEWYESGDLAYTVGGEVYITARTKDLIIRAGRNVYPQELEAAAGDIEGVRKGCVAVFGSQDRVTGTERIVVVAETRETGEEEQARLRRRIEAAAASILDAPPDDIVLAPPRTVPKTSSGKIRRNAARELYESGGLAAGAPALWRQLARLGAKAFFWKAQRVLRSVWEAAYGIYCWLVLALLLLAAAPLLTLLTDLPRRFGLARRTARLALKLMGVPMETSGVDGLPPSGVILAANHSSYLDGLILVAALPGEAAFVAKNELAAAPFVGWLLRCLDTLFVERVDAEGGVGAGRRAVEAARAGKRLLFFPEGTFTRAEGLLEFRLGAFLTAAEAGLPVVPIIVRGTRSMLRDEQWLPRPGKLSVEAGAPLAADGSDFSAAVRLRDRVRAKILEGCGEPDRAGERVVFRRAGVERVDASEEE